MLVLSFLLLALTLGQPPQPAESTGSVAGVITVGGTNTAVVGAHITLLPDMRADGSTQGPARRMEAMGMPPQALTGQDGRFALPVFEWSRRVPVRDPTLKSPILVSPLTDQVG